jgi:hypothetical protein
VPPAGPTPVVPRTEQLPLPDPAQQSSRGGQVVSEDARQRRHGGRLHDRQQESMSLAANSALITSVLIASPKM